MKTIMRAAIVVVALTMAAHAVEPRNCQTMLTLQDIASALGDGVRLQPVFSGGGLKGWRIYEVGHSAQLSASSIAEGTLMTHVCRVTAREVFAGGGDVCCSTDASREFEVTLHVEGQDRTILVHREAASR